MTVSVPAPMTAEEFLEWAGDAARGDCRFEMREEGIFDIPLDTEFHNAVAAVLSTLLVKYVVQRKIGRVAGRTGTIVARKPDVVLVPDIVFFSTSRTFRELRISKNSFEIPTLVIEILSLSDRPRDTYERVQKFLRSGISLVWLVDPEDEIVSVYKRGVDPQFLGIRDCLDGNGVLPDLSIPIADIFKLPNEL